MMPWRRDPLSDPPRRRIVADCRQKARVPQSLRRDSEPRATPSNSSLTISCDIYRRIGYGRLPGDEEARYGLAAPAATGTPLALTGRLVPSLEAPGTFRRLHISDTRLQLTGRLLASHAAARLVRLSAHGQADL